MLTNGDEQGSVGRGGTSKGFEPKNEEERIEYGKEKGGKLIQKAED